jgi:hypothetical protein
MTQLAIFIVAFLAGMALDFVWALCVEAVQKRRPATAANLALAYYALMVVSTLLIVAKCVPAVVAYGLGNWVGTYLAVRWKRCD